ncbi:hypothetical protein D3C76_198590 [compost metagenome]
MDQAERRGMRADNKTRDDIAQHYRLLEAMEENRHDAGNQHDYRQVLNETDGMHGAGLLVQDQAATTPENAG